MDKDKVINELAFIILKERLQAYVADRAYDNKDTGLYDMADYLLEDYSSLIKYLSEKF